MPVNNYLQKKEKYINYVLTIYKKYPQLILDKDNWDSTTDVLDLKRLEKLNLNNFKELKNLKQQMDEERKKCADNMAEKFGLADHTDLYAEYLKLVGKEKYLNSMYKENSMENMIQEFLEYHMNKHFTFDLKNSELSDLEIDG
ncbi:hypothetical protein F8158_23045 [Bacillus cereus]|uniref:Uncharacterized protein n=2 Tax=Bacillus cereus TaxID=1396 RepID=A0AB34D4A6_BACCE|nr:hypothetical protein F8158_23045 [Bacillus cereus]